MEELTVLGLIYFIVGLILALLLSVTLILTIVGILLIVMGKKYSTQKYGRYPMLQPCPACGMHIDVTAVLCPYCKGQGATQAA